MTCCSSRCARPTTTTSRPRLCGVCPRPAARPSRFLRRPAASTRSRRRATRRRAVVRAPLLPSAASIDDDRRLRDLRKDNKITAILHTGYPIRHWDNDLGPGAPHLLALDLGDASRRSTSRRSRAERCGTPTSTSAPTARFVVTSWQRPAPGRVAALRARAHRRRDRGAHRHRRRTRRRSVEPGHLAGRVGGGIHPRVLLHARRVRRESAWATCGSARRRSELAARLGSLAGVGDVVARRRRRLIVTADDGGRGPVFSDRHRRRRGRRRLTTDDYAYTDVTAAPGGVVYALRSSYARRRIQCVSIPTAPSPRCRASTLPRLPGSLTEVTGDRRRRRPRCGRGWCCPHGDDARATGAVGPRRTAGQLELLALAVEPVGARRARLRGAAAGPGAVDRLRPGLHPAGLGRLGRCAVRRSDGRHRRRMRAPAHRRRRAPRRWAARSAATWRTGSPATPTGSTRSSPTPACGRSTSSAPPPTPPTTGCAR